jgi:hypothetical protein
MASSMLTKLTLEVATLSVKVTLICLMPLNTCWIVILQSIHICEENLPFGNKKRVASCIKNLFWKKGPLWREKRELNCHI